MFGRPGRGKKSAYGSFKSAQRFTKKPTAKQVRTNYYGDNWDKISRTCLEMANHICQDCGERANHAHHIVPKSRGGSDLQINLKAVCADCHSKYHKRMQKKNR